MDEPLGAVDFQMRQLLQVQLESMLQKNRKTALMVTHDVDEAIYLSDRVIVMSRDRGKILADIKIELPRPRDRKDRRYHQYTNELSDILRSALNGEVKNEGDEELLEFIQKTDQQGSKKTAYVQKGALQEQ
jgi:NitT/TauT family transport system ATP-binding protein